MKTFEHKLRVLMEKYRLSEKDVARIFGVGQGTVQKWLEGLVEPIQFLQETIVKCSFKSCSDCGKKFIEKDLRIGHWPGTQYCKRCFNK